MNKVVTKFKNIVIKNQELPIRFFTSEECNDGDYQYEESFINKVEIKEITLYNGQYLDKEDFGENLYYDLYGDYDSEESLNACIDEIMQNTNFEKTICVYLG